ncbi:MAG: hypothetical protein IPK14_01210 [Blastocatellia bacterium]|nr:hypothetical protein [Blastocatellia bacterium]
MKNYQDLVNKFYSLTFSLQLRSIFIKIVAFALFIATFLINMAWFGSTGTNFFSRAVGTIVSTLIVPALFMIIASPLTSMAIASLYFKSRQAKNSNFGHTGSSEEATLSERMRFTPFRKVLTAGALALSILVGSFSYIAMVPPSAIAFKPSRLTIEKVDDSENAWVEYNLAIQDMLDFPMVASKTADKSVQEIIGDLSIKQMSNPGYVGLEKVALEEEKFNEKQLSYLDKHQATFKHLIAGSKLSKSQFTSEMPTFTTRVPNLLQMRGLSIVASAQVQRLISEGKTQEAVELALANYEMATDVGAEPNASLIASLISVVCRGIAAKSLFTIIYSQATDAKMDIEIARQISAQDRRMPNAFQALSVDLQASQNSFEDILLNNNLSKFNNDISPVPVAAENLAKYFPGLRVRIYNSLIDITQNCLKQLQPGLENWDFQALEEFNKEMESKVFQNVYDPATYIAANLVYISLPSGAATMKSFYNSNNMGQSLTAFAAISAYKKNQNQFPATLEMAMSEAGLSTPVDLATGKQIGYRLENANSIIWFAGADGQDNGGQTPYTIEERVSSIAGKDLIFKYGEIPFHKKGQ